VVPPCSWRCFAGGGDDGPDLTIPVPTPPAGTVKWLPAQRQPRREN
jgi:hypothetical protein